MIIDIRQKDVVIDRIIFANLDSGTGPVQMLNKGENGQLYPIRISGEDWDEDYEVGIGSKEDAQNMIMALQKAIDLGWFD